MRGNFTFCARDWSLFYEHWRVSLKAVWNDVIFVNTKFAICKQFLQIKGCAVRTICEPSYANIFTAKFVEKFIYTFVKDRHIDDIFMIWSETKEQFDKFLSK